MNEREGQNIETDKLSTVEGTSEEDFEREEELKEKEEKESKIQTDEEQKNAISEENLEDARWMDSKETSESDHGPAEVVITSNSAEVSTVEREKKEEDSIKTSEALEESAEQSQEEEKDSDGVKDRRVLKTACIIAAMLAVTAGSAYGAASYYYSDKFLQGTTINGIDCSGLTAVQVE